MFKPMLACSTIPTLDSVKFPVMSSPKLDGIRCVMVDGVAFSRSLKRIPNLFIQSELAGLHGLDGELMVHGDFNSVQSAVMSIHGEPDFTYEVFDSFADPDVPFKLRIHMDVVHKRVEYVKHTVVTNKEVLTFLWQQAVADGYEGLIVRDPDGPYKHGRSTAKQGWMLKLKYFRDAEATIVVCDELMHNLDTSTKEKANMVGGGTLGSFLVNYDSHLFRIGTGLTDAQRAKLWAMRDELPGTKLKFKYQELSSYGVPRFPVFLSLRDAIDV